MASQDEILERVLERVSDKVADSVKGTVAEAVQRELSSAMSKALVESEFYRQVNDEMRLGLRGIYREISSASVASVDDSSCAVDAGEAQKLFRDAARQVEEIMSTTLEATEKIMASAETLLNQREEAAAIITALKADCPARENLARLGELNREMQGSLTNIITDLSFQDLTGQRLKKVVTAIGSIRETVFDLYVSTGLMLKTREETPDKDPLEIAEESRRKVKEFKESELKGPSSDGASQAEVDDLLTSLGL